MFGLRGLDFGQSAGYTIGPAPTAPVWEKHSWPDGGQCSALGIATVLLTLCWSRRSMLGDPLWATGPIARWNCAAAGQDALGRASQSAARTGHWQAMPRRFRLTVIPVGRDGQPDIPHRHNKLRQRRASAGAATRLVCWRSLDVKITSPNATPHSAMPHHHWHGSPVKNRCVAEIHKHRSAWSGSPLSEDACRGVARWHPGPRPFAGWGTDDPQKRHGQETDRQARTGSDSEPCQARTPSSTAKHRKSVNPRPISVAKPPHFGRRPAA